VATGAAVVTGRGANVETSAATVTAAAGESKRRPMARRSVFVALTLMTTGAPGTPGPMVKGAPFEGDMMISARVVAANGNAQRDDRNNMMADLVRERQAGKPVRDASI
jgi:hypothetical protein